MSGIGQPGRLATIIDGEAASLLSHRVAINHFRSGTGVFNKLTLSVTERLCLLMWLRSWPMLLLNSAAAFYAKQDGYSGALKISRTKYSIWPPVSFHDDPAIMDDGQGTQGQIFQ